MSSDESSFERLPLLFVFGVIALVFVSVIGLVGLQLVGGITDAAGGDPVDKTSSPDPITGQYVSFQDMSRAATILQIYSVNDSTGFGIQLDGTDTSYVRSNENITITGTENLTISTWARVRDGAQTENMTVVSAGGRVIIQYDYNGTGANWTAWYYDDGSANSWRVNATGPNQPGNLTNVMVVKNTTHLSIYRNNTLGETVNVSSGSNSINVNTNSTNWNGTIDETRTFDEALNDSQRASLVNDPVFPLKNASRTARITYDEGSGTITRIYFADVDATVNNGEWVLALAGTELTEGVDYDLQERSGAIKALAGGRIDGAPVVWIDYEFQESDVDELVPGIQNGFSLLAVGVLAIPAAVVIGGLMFAFIFAFRAGEDGERLRLRRDGGR